MALAHIVIGSSSPSPHCPCFINGVVTCRRRVVDAVTGVGKGRESFPVELKLGSNSRYVAGLAVSSVNDVASSVDNGQIVSEFGLEIPVTCYQILGVSEKAEKDEIVKAAMELKKSEIEEGYTGDVPSSRQDLLMDVRDKLLFEPEFAGNKRENIAPKTLCIPWPWLPASLCLLQEVGEAKLVMEIGRVSLQRRDSKPYTHDILLSMALSECSIAKIGFEKNKVSEGFEALARAQYLLRSKISLGKLPLLTQIEESLEELAPACTIEILSSANNTERRRGAISALRELLRQGLDVDSSCRVQDWPCFLNQALSRLGAGEIVELISWEKLAEMRKNRKSIESQTQRRVVDFNCFYFGFIAHIALGFSTRQLDLISKAKTICECLVASESVDMKFEESFCLFLLGQESATVAFEKLRQLEINKSSNPKSFESDTFKSEKGKENINRSLEIWLKDYVLSLFQDTQDCSPSLASFFLGPKRTLNNSSQKLKLSSSPFNPLHENKTINKPSLNSSSSIKHLGEAVKQLAPASQSDLATSSPGTPPTSSVLKRNLDSDQMRRNWWAFDLAQRLVFSAVLGFVLFGTFKLLSFQFGRAKLQIQNQIKSPPPFISGSVWNRLGKVSAMLSLDQKRYPNSASEKRFGNLNLNIWRKREMDLDEAEEIVKQWQEVKADALGPTHQIDELSFVLDESMLSKWEEVAKTAKDESCFWRFVLLKMAVIRAEIISDEIGSETAEIEALLEEAAELVDESQPKKPSYYSTYKVQYRLKRQDDRSWRICSGDVQNLEKE